MAWQPALRLIALLGSALFTAIIAAALMAAVRSIVHAGTWTQRARFAGILAACVFIFKLWLDVLHVLVLSLSC